MEAKQEYPEWIKELQGKLQTMTKEEFEEVFEKYKIPFVEEPAFRKPVSKDRFVFKALPRLLDMIEPTDRAKTYTARLADTLEKEGYITDAKIVRERIKVMNGEKVAMAVMDEELASKVWHGVEENPEENKDFAFVDYDGVMWSRYRIEDLFHGWQSFVNMTGMTKWVYTSDLIKL